MESFTMVDNVCFVVYWKTLTLFNEAVVAYIKIWSQNFCGVVQGNHRQSHWIQSVLRPGLRKVAVQIFGGAKTELWPRPPHCWGFWITQNCTRTNAHPHPVGLLPTNDQLFAEAATCKTHNKYKRRKTVHSAGFETGIPPIERPQTYALDRTTTEIGLSTKYMSENFIPWNNLLH
jgi:hypothetical protein